MHSHSPQIVLYGLQTIVCVILLSYLPICNSGAAIANNWCKDNVDPEGPLLNHARAMKHYLKTYRSKCWYPKGSIYLKMVGRDMDNKHLVYEMAFHLTSCILEERGQAPLLCRPYPWVWYGNGILACMVYQHSYAIQLLESFNVNIPLMACDENIGIAASDVIEIQKLLHDIENLASREDANDEPRRPIFYHMKQEMQNCLANSEIEDYEIFLESVYASITQYISEGFNMLLNLQQYQ